MIRNALFGLLGLTYASAANAEWALKLSKGGIDLSRETYNLHMLVFWSCVAIAIVVFGVMIYSLIMHRKSKRVIPAMFSHSTAADIVWTLIPIIILVVMTVPAARTMVSLEARQKQSNVEPVSVENYLLDVGNPVVVPRGTKVRLLPMRSNRE